MHNYVSKTYSEAAYTNLIETFTTAEGTPLTFTDEFDECPNTGTIQVNNATIVFGTPIAVTVNGVTQNYADCTAMDSAGYGMCM